jgi:hypothetical protein
MAPDPVVPSPYHAPPRTQNADGETRRVGIEVELGGLSVEQTIEVMHSVLGGTVQVESETDGTLQTERFGKFKVELDSTKLKGGSFLAPLEAVGLQKSSQAAQLIGDAVLRVARTVVPIEVVSPPIPWDRLAELDPLWTALQQAGAQGTSSSLLNAFGLHFNPEPPDLEVSTIDAAVRSFLLLEDWIIESASTDLSRRVVPFIHTFPEDYRRHVLRPTNTPTWDDFVASYVEHNPTRNRSLDLLPLLAHIAGSSFGNGISDRIENWSLVKPRPTYHYRLPDCLVSEAGWSPAIDWNRWVVVERLAESEALLRELSADYLQTSDLPFRWQSSGWIAHLRAKLATFVEDAAFSRR